MNIGATNHGSELGHLIAELLADLAEDQEAQTQMHRQLSRTQHEEQLKAVAARRASADTRLVGSLVGAAAQAGGAAFSEHGETLGAEVVKAGGTLTSSAAARAAEGAELDAQSFEVDARRVGAALADVEGHLSELEEQHQRLRMRIDAIREQAHQARMTILRG